MKANTKIVAGIRNVGGTGGAAIFEGTVSESIVWLAQRIGELYMKNRFDISIGRTEADVLLGLKLESKSKGSRSGFDADFMAELMSKLTDGDDDDDSSAEREMPSIGTTSNRIPGDDYQG